MYYQEKKNVVNIISAIVITGIYFWYVFHNHPEAGMSTDELLRFWAKTFLVLIPIRIVGAIVIHILLGIFSVITSDDKNLSMDERDKLIELKASRVEHYVFGAGFMLAMAALILDMSVSVMFATLAIGGILSEIFGNITQLYFYKRGV